MILLLTCLHPASHQKHSVAAFSTPATNEVIVFHCFVVSLFCCVFLFCPFVAHSQKNDEIYVTD